MAAAGLAGPQQLLGPRRQRLKGAKVVEELQGFEATKLSHGSKGSCFRVSRPKDCIDVKLGLLGYFEP